MNVSRKQNQLIIAVVIGVAVLFFNKSYLDNRISEYKDQKQIEVIRAKQAIPAGSLLRSSVVERVKVPERYAPKARITADQLSQYSGLEFSVDVVKGDYILQSYFKTAAVSGATLSAQLDGENYRAISLPVDDTNSFDRSIVTGDKIDIVFSFSRPPIDHRISIVLLQNVPVIATGSYSSSEQELGEGGERAKRYNTLTLRVTAQDALRLNYARQEGKLSVLLRNPKDNQVLDLPAIGTVLDLLSPGDKERVQETEKEQLEATKMQEEQYKEQIKSLMDMQRQQSKNGMTFSPGGK